MNENENSLINDNKEMIKEMAERIDELMISNQQLNDHITRLEETIITLFDNVTLDRINESVA